MAAHIYKAPFCLFINPVTSEAEKRDSYDVQLPLFPSASLFTQEHRIRKGRVFTCKRPVDESLEMFFERFSANLNAYFGKVSLWTFLVSYGMIVPAP